MDNIMTNNYATTKSCYSLIICKSMIIKVTGNEANTCIPTPCKAPDDSRVISGAGKML